MQCGRNKLLRSESRIHRHDQHIIHNVEHFRERLDRRRWIDHHPGQAVVTLDQMQSSVQVPASFLVHGNPVRARIGKRGNEFIRILDHQVAIERQLRDLTQRLDDGRSDRKVGNEVSIHNVDVDETCTALARDAHLLAESGKISRKD